MMISMIPIVLLIFFVLLIIVIVLRLIPIPNPVED